MSKIGQWFRRRFKELDLLEKYFPLLFTRWQAAIWGGSVLAVAFGWRFITSDWPYPVKLTACVVALFFAGYYLWRADHLRLEKKLEIVHLRINAWTVAHGLANAGHRAKAYYFGVINRSEGVTVEGVNVQLNRISPEVENLGWLPIHLHLQHDDPIKPEDQIKSFSLNPGAVRNVDLVSALDGNTVFSIVHVVSGATHEIHFDPGVHRLEVMITAANMPALFVWFGVWRDEAGALMCEIEK